MKVGPKSSLRPFLHRALQFYLGLFRHVISFLQICKIITNFKQHSYLKIAYC